jgi:CPA2 family monovalent cation:H+ antiporter-2
VQIAGVNRGGLRILNPRAQETVLAGDELLALGAPVHIAAFKVWVRERIDETPEDVMAD